MYVADDFDATFRRLYPQALRLATRMLGDRVAGEDVAAEALARTLLRWGELRANPHLTGWVLRVTVNLCIDVTRRHKWHPQPSPAGTDEEDVVRRLVLTRAMRKLPRRQREAIALRFLSDLSEADVARSLGISSGSVKTHLHRGLATLREILGPMNLEEDHAIDSV